MSIDGTSAGICTDIDLPEFDVIDKKSKSNGDILYILVPKDRPKVALNAAVHLSIYTRSRTEACRILITSGIEWGCSLRGRLTAVGIAGI